MCVIPMDHGLLVGYKSLIVKTVNDFELTSERPHTGPAMSGGSFHEQDFDAIGRLVLFQHCQLSKFDKQDTSISLLTQRSDQNWRLSPGS